MAFSLKDIIFPLFGVYAKQRDTDKDGAGKGIWERYQESLGEDFDEEVLPLIDNLLANTVEPNTFLSDLIEHREASLGNPLVIVDDEDIRRKIIQFHQTFYRMKSTPFSFEFAFRILGMDSVTITELVEIAGFDSDVTLDDVTRIFDSTSACCGQYTIDLTGSLTHDQELEDAINRINKYLRPLNAITREITYNGSPITLT